MPQSGPESYPRQTILLYNLQRATDKERPAMERLESMKLVTYLGGEDPSVRTELAGLLGETGGPPEVQQAALEFLLRKGDPSAGEYVIRVLPGLPRGTARDAVLEWLSRHGSDPNTLGHVVKYWAEEPSPTGMNEPLFRQVVERVTKKNWERALIEALNAPAFTARGSAIAVLSRRMPAPALRQIIQATEPQSEAFAALRAFLDGFDYLPSGSREFLAATNIYKAQQYIFDDAIKLFREWQNQHGYQFNIRDFHLISRLARDPLRKDRNMRRTHLVLELGQALKPREHVHHRPIAPGAGDDYIDQFWLQTDALTHADLWNLYLLNGMLTRERVQQALRVMADRDRADRRSAWGGLVFYRSGQAEAILYPASQDNGENDLVYVPSAGADADGMDALCRFQAHFERPDNAARAGPSETELRDVKARNYYGLVLTSLSDDAFCAHYYTPRGVVISLGVFPFRK
jgi:hypothetical protein